MGNDHLCSASRGTAATTVLHFAIFAVLVAILGTLLFIGYKLAGVPYAIGWWLEAVMPSMESLQGAICGDYAKDVLTQHIQNGLSAEQIQTYIEYSTDAPQGSDGAAEYSSIDNMCGTPAEIIDAVDAAR